MITRLALTLLICVTATIWAGLLGINGWEINLSYFAPLSLVVTVISGLLLVLEKWAWAWPGIRLLTKKPDLRGTWLAEIQSQWADLDSADGPVDAYMVVRQSMSGVHLRLFTRESESVSITASLSCDADGVYNLAAIYRNVPRLSLRDSSPIHHGGLILRPGGPPEESMEGDYWTDRDSKGEMRLQRISARAMHDFESARSLPTKSDTALARRLGISET